MTNFRKSRIWLGLLLAAAFALGAAFSQDALAQEYKPKAKVKTLVDKPLHGVAGKTVIIKQITFPPGFVGGKHFHPGTVFVYVLDGKLTVVTKDRTRTLSKGDLYEEVPQMVMRGKNVSASEPVTIVVFQVGETGKPMMIKAK